jgi:hypothetical protein
MVGVLGTSILKQLDEGLATLQEDDVTSQACPGSKQLVRSHD